MYLVPMEPEHIPSQAVLDSNPLSATFQTWTARCSCGIVGQADHLPTLITGMGAHRQGAL